MAKNTDDTDTVIIMPEDSTKPETLEQRKARFKQKYEILSRKEKKIIYQLAIALITRSNNGEKGLEGVTMPEKFYKSSGIDTVIIPLKQYIEGENLGVINYPSKKGANMFDYYPYAGFVPLARQK